MKVIELSNRIIFTDEIVSIYEEYKCGEFSNYSNYYIETKHKNISVNKSDYEKVKEYLLSLNDEVEIIEEEKKIPEKLSTWYSVEVTQSDEENVEYENYNFETMYEKINEICDCLKNKGDE